MARAGGDGTDGRNGTDGPQPWPIEIWIFKKEFWIMSWFVDDDNDDKDDDNDNDDDERTKSEKSKCVSNDRSRHDDQNEYRIIKIGAILEG